MPLSEEEQRILQEIEARLYEESPELVREVSSTTLYSHAFRNIKWASLGFVGGLAVLVGALALTSNALLSFVGFLAMLGFALWFEQNLRKMGRAGWREMTQSVRSNGVRGMIGATGRRARGRFRRR